MGKDDALLDIIKKRLCQVYDEKEDKKKIKALVEDVEKAIDKDDIKGDDLKEYITVASEVRDAPDFSYLPPVQQENMQ